MPAGSRVWHRPQAPQKPGLRVRAWLEKVSPGRASVVQLLAVRQDTNRTGEDRIVYNQRDFFWHPTAIRPVLRTGKAPKTLLLQTHLKQVVHRVPATRPWWPAHREFVRRATDKRQTTMVGWLDELPGLWPEVKPHLSGWKQKERGWKAGVWEVLCDHSDADAVDRCGVSRRCGCRGEAGPVRGSPKQAQTNDSRRQDDPESHCSGASAC